MKRIIVIGGGIAGLAAAHRIVELAKERSLDLELLLLEASPRLGGSIATERVGDFLVEAGPDSFITEKPWALRLCERLGLTSRLVSTQSAYQKIYIVHRGKLEALPEGFFLLAPTRLWPFIQTPLFSWPGKLRMAGELLIPRGEMDNDESLGAFVRRRFGSEALSGSLNRWSAASMPPIPTSSALPPPCRASKKWSDSGAASSMPCGRRSAAARASREAGSGARWSLFVTLAGGMQELVDTIAKRLPEGGVRLNAPVDELDSRRQSKSMAGHCSATTKSSSADAVILATPAFQAGAILLERSTAIRPTN